MNSRRLATKLPEPGSTLGMRGYTYPSIVTQLQKGFAYKTYVVFQKKSKLDHEAIGRVMGVPDRTLARRKKEGVFKSDESERLLRLSRVYERAVELFEGDGDAAKRWLESPAKALGGQTPLNAAETEIGAQEVDRLIGRIEHGVVS